MTSVKINSNNDEMILGPVIFTLAAFLLFFICVKLLNYVLGDNQIKVPTPKKTHNWTLTNILKRVSIFLYLYLKR